MQKEELNKVFRSGLSPLEIKWSCICARKEMCYTQYECVMGFFGCCFFFLRSGVSSCGLVLVFVPVVWSCVVCWVVVIVLMRGPRRYWLFESAAFAVTFQSIPFRAVFRRGEPGHIAREIVVVFVGSVRL